MRRTTLPAPGEVAKERLSGRPALVELSAVVLWDTSGQAEPCDGAQPGQYREFGCQARPGQAEGDPKLASAAASFSNVSNTVSSFVTTSRSFSRLVTFNSFSTPPLFFVVT